MATANETILNEQIAHAIDLQGYSNNVVNRILKLLKKVDADLMSQIAIALDKLPPSQFNIDRLTTVLKAVRELNSEAYANVSDELNSELKQLTEYEIGVQKHMLDSVLPVPVATVTANQVYAAAMSRPFQGKILKEYLSGIEEARAIKIRDAIRIGYVESQTNAEIIKRIRGTRALNYADGLLQVSRRDAESLVITAISHTSNFARSALYEANSDVVLGQRYTATLDLRTTELCASRDGNEYPIGKPKPAIPAHWRCLPADSLILARCGISGVSKRWFDGDMIVIKTAANRELSCTPNHPILTNRGWVAAESLNFTDKIICDGGSEWLTPIVNSDNNNVIASIHDVTKAFISLSDVLTVPVPTSTPDFHGDGIDGEVAIISSYRLLRNGFDATLDKHVMQGDLVMRSSNESRFTFNRSFRNFFKGLFSGSSNRVSLFSKVLPILKCSYSHSCKLLLATASSFNIKTIKSIFYNNCRNIESFSNSINANSTIKHIDSSNNIEVLLPSINSNNASGFNPSIEDAASDIKLANNLISGNICKVFSDSLIEFKRVSFSGHVYNLDTVEGWYSAGGIVTHNCRSLYVPVLKSWKDLGIPIDEISPSTRASLDGQVPAKLTYQTWLEKQSAERQDTVLGKTKADLFRNGGLTLDKFVSKQGHSYTINELKALHPQAFK